MRFSSRPLSLAASFAAVGGASGWLWYGLFSNPMVRLAAAGHQASAAACAALAAAIAGALLAPTPPANSWVAPRPSPARIVSVVLGAGALAGAAVAIVLGGTLENVATGCVGGLLGAVPFAPVGALLVAAARRAERARRGSIVARSDGRAAASLVAVALGCASLLTLPDWPAAASGLTAAPMDAFALVAAAALLVLVAMLADLAGLARINRFRCDADDADAELGGPEAARGTVDHVDMGLGDDIAMRHAAGTAYRGGRPVALLVGDPYAARAALKRTLARGAAGLALLEIVGVAHGLARGVDTAASYSAWLCEEGRETACRTAALLAERASAPLPEAERLHQRACDNGDSGSCLAIDLLHRQSAPPW